MTIQAISNAIANLIIKRRRAHGNDIEQDRINEKLTKLYELKRILKLQQAGE